MGERQTEDPWFNPGFRQNEFSKLFFAFWNDAKIITKKIMILLTHDIPNLRAARLAQLVEHQTFNLRGMGSSHNTLRSTFLRDTIPAEIAQMGER